MGWMFVSPIRCGGGLAFQLLLNGRLVNNGTANWAKDTNLQWLPNSTTK
jgi:hypothetical protein